MQMIFLTVYNGAGDNFLPKDYFKLHITAVSNKMNLYHGHISRNGLVETDVFKLNWGLLW